LIRAEDKAAEKINNDAHVQVPTGIWIQKLVQGTTQGAELPPPGENGVVHPPESVINIVCEAVNLTDVASPAKQDVVFSLQNELQACPLFDPTGTQLNSFPPITEDPAKGTFTFGATIILKQPLKF
jgi:hypothetical protein